MSQDKIIIRFDEVSFEYGHTKPILDEVSFSVRQGMKFALMGQNGAGKSTLFALITGDAKPDSGKVSIDTNLSIATARQVIPRGQMNLTIREFFAKCFSKKVYDIDPKIEAVLGVVHLSAPYDRIIKSFSGGQQARLLLASALIQNPDILLLDEPTNNLDKAGIAHLTDFLKKYQKTVIVISHDAGFLNSFTDGVLYLDVFTRKIERYVGNYFDVVKEISARIEKENSKNAQLAKEIQENKDKANFFAQKGGGMRMVAKRMREKAEKLEEEKVDVRREDKTIRHFTIPFQQDLTGEIIRITSFTTLKNHNPRTQRAEQSSYDGKPVTHKANISLKKNNHLLLSGPNGIGKSTLLESIAKGNPRTQRAEQSSYDGNPRTQRAEQSSYDGNPRTQRAEQSSYDGDAPGVSVAPGVRIGYYRQDFSTLNFDDTVYDSLFSIMKERDEHTMRSTAAGFLITAESMRTKIGDLSEGQKGLVAFARLVLQKPGLLILDEPTNHINFRHIPFIAEALNTYQGAMILVSHVPSFVQKIRIDEVLDLEKL